MKFVTEQVAAAINEALDQMQPAELRVASGEAKGKIAYNYYAPDLYDRRASVLQVRGLDGKPIGTLVNYAIHPEVMGSDQGILSPDLVGPWYDRIEKGAGGIALFMNGAQGGMVTADNRNLEQPPRDALRAYWNDSRTWAECERIGELLAAESLRIIDPAAWQKSPTLHNNSMEGAGWTVVAYDTRLVSFRIPLDGSRQPVRRWQCLGRLHRSPQRAQRRSATRFLCSFLR